MPKGTRVSRCVDKVKKSKDEGAAIAICQASTKQGYATGKALKEALKTQFGSKGSKLSKTSSRHTTNPGESKAEARDDAEKFTKKHGQQASQTHKQTGKIPGPKPGEKNEQVEAYRDLAYQLHEALPALLAPLAAGAKVAGAAIGKVAAAAGKGAAAVGRGAVKAGGSAAKAAGRMVKKKATDMAKDKAAEAGAEGVATGSDIAKKKIELAQQAASDKDLEETKMNNAYVRRLMEDEEPTDKDLEDIKKEKPAKIPKKKYFGGETDPKKVDTKAAIASHRAGIKAAGKKGVADLKKERQAAGVDDWTVYHQMGKIIAETEFPKGPTAQAYSSKGRAKDTGEGQGTASIKDPLVRKETEKTKANIDKKTQSDTNPKVSDLVQGSMNRRRGESRRGQGPSGLGKESRADAKADAARDKYRRMAPGDK
jgi:hypothetical protein